MTLCDLPIKTFHTSQRNQIYSEASSTHFSAINLSYFTLYSSKCSLFQIHHYISENNQSYRRTQFNLTLCDLPIKTLLTSQRNQIYSEASSKHFSSNNLSYFTLYSSKCSLFQIHHYISENYQTSREHSLIWHSRLPIKKLLTSQRKQIYSEASSTHFSVINLSYTYALLIKILVVPNTSLHFRKLSDLSRNYSLIWQFRIPIKTLLASQRNQIYSEASSTHFSAINLSYFTLYPLNSSWIYIKYPTFQKTIRLIL